MLSVYYYPKICSIKKKHQILRSSVKEKKKNRSAQAERVSLVSLAGTGRDDISMQFASRRLGILISSMLDLYIGDCQVLLLLIILFRGWAKSRKSVYIQR